MTTAELGRRAPPPVHGVPAPQSQPLVRTLLALRVLLTVVLAGGAFLVPWRPSPLAWLTVLVSVLSLSALVVRRPLGMVAHEAWALPVLLLAGGLVDTRVLHVVPLPNPLDGYAVGTMSVVGAVWGWRVAVRLLVATVGVEAALAVAEVGIGLDTLVLLCQRAPWLVVAAAVTSHIGARTAEAAAAAAAEAEGQERLVQLRALHDRAVQTLTAVVAGAASGWARIAAEAPAMWERIRTDAAAERDRLRHAVPADPVPAGDDVGGAVAAVVRGHRLGTQVELRMHGLPVVPARVATAVARAVGEALTNVARHAPGATATVAIDGAPGRVEVRVEDTGLVGSPDCVDAARPPVEGFGISQSLRGRMAAVGGRAEVASPADAGTTVVLSWRRPDSHPRPWPGAAGQLPRRACRGIVVAVVGWHLTASLSVLFVTWRLGWTVRPLLAVAAVLVPALLLLAAVLLPACRVLIDRGRPAIAPALLLVGTLVTALGGVVVRPEHLLLSYADPLTSTAATTTAVVTFLAGPAFGAVAFVASSLALAVAAPLLNGYAPADVVTATTVERLVATLIAWVLFVRIGPLLSASVAARRRAAVVRARVAESAAISRRLVPVLSAIAGTAVPDEAVRRQAFVALAWARLRLTGSAEPAEERIADALAAVAVWHPGVTRPPQIVRVSGAPSAATVCRAAQALDVVLGAFDGTCSDGITVTASGGASQLRLTVACRAGARPAPGVLADVRRTLARRAQHVEVHDAAEGLHVLITVGARESAPHLASVPAGA